MYSLQAWRLVGTVRRYRRPHEFVRFRKFLLLSGSAVQPRLARRRFANSLFDFRGRSFTHKRKVGTRRKEIMRRWKSGNGEEVRSTQLLIVALFPVAEAR